MYYPDRALYYSPLLFQPLKEFEASNLLKRTKRRGPLEVHPDNSLIVFRAIMLLKAVNRFKAQHRWLIATPDWLPMLKLQTVPARRTLSSHYKPVVPKLEVFVAYLGDRAIGKLSEAAKYSYRARLWGAH